MAATATFDVSRPRAFAVDKLGALVAVIVAAGWVLLPFATFKANRIVQGQSKIVFDALPGWEAVLLCVVIAVSLPVTFYRTPTLWRLLVSAIALAALFILIGQTAAYLTPPGNTLARISPGAGFWVLIFAFLLLAADALTRLHLKPLPRIGILALVAAALAALLLSGDWNGLSILKEYFVRADSFWDMAKIHIVLAFGSLLAATIVGVPLGVLCYRVPRLRTVILNILNGVQTIPSIALFGLLIAPLAWVAANVPGAAAIGVSGIGFTPAIVALFIYSLLPVVANTVVGLLGVPDAANDAARGMGMTDRQRLFSIEMPLAFPVILTGIRIVLVQNIGLATVAALIGGGGFGIFVFQGIGQTALDLVLLGAVPTVVLAFAAAIILDALVEITSVRGGAIDALAQPCSSVPMIEIDELSKVYDGTTVVDDVSLKIEEGEIAVIVGTSGSGKTTLLRMINRLVEPSAGRVRINGLDTRATPPFELRRRIGYAIQGHGLFPHRTVAQNIATVPQLLNWSRPKVDARVDELLNLFQLDPGQFRNRMPAELSGGQQQRVGVARVLAAAPKVLLMDEPFGALDPIIRAKAQEDLLNIQKQFKTTIVLVTHDMEEATHLGDRIAVMDKGSLLQYATPEEIIAHPATEFVDELIGAGERPFRLLSLSTIGDIVHLGEAEGTPMPMTTSLRDAYAECLWSRRSNLPVSDETGAIVGMVTLRDLEQRAGRPS